MDGTKIPVALFLIGASLLLPACSGCRLLVPDDGELVVVSFNVENLFDEHVDGTEYRDFLPDSGWDADDVARRLQQLGDALNRVRPSPDILVLTEMENEAILDRLIDEHLVDLPLRYRAFAAGPASATGVSVAGRYPIVDVRTLLARAGDTPPLRPILEVRFRLPETDLIVFANHWKSKRGSAPGTEELRRAAARLLNARLADLAATEPDVPVLVAGDLNEQPREIEYAGFDYPTALIPRDLLAEWNGGTGTVPEWYDDAYRRRRRYLPLESDLEGLRRNPVHDGSMVLLDSWALTDDPGSYWYFGRWEQIDHILLNAAAAGGPSMGFRSFGTVPFPGDDGGEGLPRSWRDGGVSDHLPVIAVMERTE
jgi:endonuclease/exonuclease/phosphatase family metal-dependent hydrolase